MSLILNLVYPEKSDIEYDIVKFSDSQTQFTLLDTVDLHSYEVNIHSRMSWDDLQVIIAANNALREEGVNIVRLYTPYFLGDRSDRKFQKGSTNYLKMVLGPIINDQDFDEVITLDPHSDVLEGCINVYTKIDNTELVKWALEYIYDNPCVLQANVPYIFVSPDAGALKKIYTVAESIYTEYGATPEIVVASKHRDIKTGKILSTEVPMQPSHALKDFIIVDDIADGARTFIEIAKKIKETFPDANIYLIVTHGIFSQGFDELSRWFTGIYTTNSIRDISEQEFTMNLPNPIPVKQFNLFV